MALGKRGNEKLALEKKVLLGIDRNKSGDERSPNRKMKAQKRVDVLTKEKARA